MSNQFAWVDFYKELARNLLNYKNNRSVMIEKVKLIFEKTDISMPTLESSDSELIDMDPFTVFGLFNKSSMKEINRIKIITAVKELFNVTADVPTTFNSIPVLNNLNATYYLFGSERGKDDINVLWELFACALLYADTPNIEHRNELSKWFDLAINLKHNGNSKITMGMYWISPNTFLNLDSRNEWYIYESGKIPAKVVNKLPKVEARISAKKYFDIVETVKEYLSSPNSELKDYKELSFEAWRYSHQINAENKALKKAQAQRENKGSGLADEDVDTVHYWIYAPGDKAYRWDEFYSRGVMGLGWHEIGDLTQYSSKEEMRDAMKQNIDPSLPYKNSALATWQFLKELKPGDVVFAKKGLHSLVGRGVVTSDYLFDPQDDRFPNIRYVKWTHKGEWEHPGQAASKTLTDITAYTDYVDKLNSIFDGDDETDDIEINETIFPEYSEEKFLEEVFMSEDDYLTLTELIRLKKNIILQGAPGVGKTFAAKRLAYSMMGEKNQDRVMMIQFHQSYTYEDFIEGFRPSNSGFEIKKGAFYNFCKKAEIDSENEYFFIIDEINRGNLSKIFGELFMLIENDKRGNSLQLLYSDERFFVPNNVYIIGMMNTADRSLAMLDYALRRRFAFFEMKPGFNSDGFKDYRINLDNVKFNNLIQTIEALNNIIASDDTLGDGFCIGHSYFCNIEEITDKTLSNIIEYEIAPLIKEYWYDEVSKAKDWIDKLRRSIK